MKGAYVAATLAVGSVVIAMVSLHGIVPVWKTLTSASARAEYSRANVPTWEVIEFANGKLDPARHKVLMVGETRAVWLKTPFLAASAHNGPQLTQVFSSEAGTNNWFARLHELGITHI